MPAKSKSQQRLFGMVHAYNKGEFHGSRALRSRIAALSRHISDADAKDFAETPHDGLPEKKKEKRAQAMVRPEVLQEMYGRVPVGTYAGDFTRSVRSEQRRSFLGHVLYGTGAGAIVGGLGAAGLGAFIVNHAAKGSKVPQADVRRHVLEAAAKCGLWGAGRGAAVGTALGAGLGVMDKIRG